MAGRRSSRVVRLLAGRSPRSTRGLRTLRRTRTLENLRLIRRQDLHLSVLVRPTDMALLANEGTQEGEPFP